MEEPAPPIRASLFHRTATRRALLAGAATAAAGGTAAVVVGMATRAESDGDSNPHASATAGDSSIVAMATAAAAEEARLSSPIEDPRRRAAHLLRRAGWGGTAAEIEEFAALTREEAADRLVNYAAIDNSALNTRVEAAAFNLTTPGRGLDGQRPQLLRDMRRWWLTRMAYTSRPLEERITYIWHGLLTTQISQVGFQRGKFMVTQNELFRSHGLGQYDLLLKAVGKDPAMMVYLNTLESTAEHPNENYARELMELYSMGEGNYTEDDVRESARAFTGWRLTPPNREQPPAGLSERERDEYLNQLYAAYEPGFRVIPREHDAGAKTFLGETGPWDGDDIVEIIMKQQATGRFITTRLFSELAYRDPSEETVDWLVETWNSSDHSVAAVVRAILVSDEFYSERAYRALVRAPVDFVIGAVRGLELETGFEQIERQGAAMDQSLFEPPSVAGWPGGEVWLSSSTFFGRVNYLDAVFFPRNNRGIPVPVLSQHTTPQAMVDEALRRLVDDNVTQETRESLHAFAATVPANDRPAAIAYLVLASPEFQLI